MGLSMACYEEEKNKFHLCEGTFPVGRALSGVAPAAQRLTSVVAWKSLPQGREALRSMLTQVQIAENKHADLLLQAVVKVAPVCLWTLACPCPGEQTNNSS